MKKKLEEITKDQKQMNDNIIEINALKLELSKIKEENNKNLEKNSSKLKIIKNENVELKKQIEILSKKLNEIEEINKKKEKENEDEKNEYIEFKKKVMDYVINYNKKDEVIKKQKENEVKKEREKIIEKDKVKENGVKKEKEKELENGKDYEEDKSIVYEDNMEDIIEKEKNILNKEEDYPYSFKYETTITNKLFVNNYYSHRACIFTSKDGLIYVAYGVKTLNLECHDILNDTKFIIIKELHKQSFDSCRHFYDELKKLDLIITSSLDCHVKVINFLKENSEIILDLNFQSQIKKPIINTAYFFNQCILVPFSNINNGKIEFYKLNYDKSSSLVGSISENAGYIFGLSHYFYKKKNNNYAIITNRYGYFVYCIDNLKSPELYHKYIPHLTKEEKEKNCFSDACINEKEENVNLIGPSFSYGYLFFWDFFKGDLLHLMKLDSGITDICLWDNNYLFRFFK